MYRKDIKKSWQVMNKLLGRVKSNQDIREVVFDGNSCTDIGEIAENFNDFFVNIAENLDNNLPNSNVSPTHYLTENFPDSFYLFPPTNDEILKLISLLKLTKTNINTIPVAIFKRIGIFIICPLVKLIGLSFMSGKFPDILKIARVTPIFKSGAHNLPSNYRPIVSLPFISKILERCIFNRMISFSNKFSLLSNNQFGFRKHLSTSDALYQLSENIYDSLNRRNHHSSVLIDLKKAFDTVNHQVLINKMFYYGFRGIVNNLLKSYLENRVQYVQMSVNKSTTKCITIGVPQGSILGPLLFLFYVNDLPKLSSNSKMTLFADDTIISVSKPNYEELVSCLSRELFLIKSWTNSNRLSINVTKTQAIKFSNIPMTINGNEPRISIDGSFLDLVTSCRYLGVELDNKLTFAGHIKTITSKIAKSTGIFYRIKNLLPLKARIDFYYSFVYPYLSYCILVWGGTYPTNLQNLIIQQKKFIRLLNDSPYGCHTSPIFHKLGILKFDDVYKYHMGMYMYVNHGKYSCMHDMNTRNSKLAVPKFHRLTQTQHAISFKGPHIWNSIPGEIQNLKTIKKFKLKDHLINFYV